MTRDQIQAEFDAFIEYPGKDKTYVTTVSTLLFAEHIARKARAQGLREAREVCEENKADWIENAKGCSSGMYDFMADAADSCAAAIKQLEGK